MVGSVMELLNLRVKLAKLAFCLNNTSKVIKMLMVLNPSGSSLLFLFCLCQFCKRIIKRFFQFNENKIEKSFAQFFPFFFFLRMAVSSAISGKEKTQRNRVEREVGGGIGMGNTCNSMADSCQCMTKPTTTL